MAARFARLLAVLGLLLGAALPSPAAAAVVRLTTSHQTAHSPVPDRSADPANASSYFGARYYRPKSGRFTSVDPVYTWEDNLVDPQRWNRYAYARGNPLSFVDPDGKNPLWIMAGIGAAVYAGWNAYVNVHQGRPWHQNIGFEAGKGFVVGATLGLAAPALGASGAVTTDAALASPLTATGTVVIGHYPRYLELANELGARAFNIPATVWERMSDAEKLAANNTFLDRAIARGNTFILTMNVSEALKKGGFWLQHEIEYLMTRGYMIGADGRSLLPPSR